MWYIMHFVFEKCLNVLAFAASAPVASDSPSTALLSASHPAASHPFSETKWCNNAHDRLASAGQRKSVSAPRPKRRATNATESVALAGG